MIYVPLIGPVRRPPQHLLLQNWKLLSAGSLFALALPVAIYSSRLLRKHFNPFVRIDWLRDVLFLCFVESTDCLKYHRCPRED